MDQQSGSLLLQVRDSNQYTITYFRILADQSKLETLKSPEGSDWHTVLVACCYPYLLLEKYPDPNDPGQKTLLVENLVTGKLLHQLEGFQLDKVTYHGFSGYYHRRATEEVVFAWEEALVPPHSPVHWRMPVFYAPGTENAEVVRQFLEQEQNGVGYEYLEHTDFIIISYYERNGSSFRRKLLVMKEGKVRHHEVQNQEIKGFAQGSFMLAGSLLIFIQNDTDIHAISL